MTDPITLLCNKLLPHSWLTLKRGDSRFSRFRWPRWVDWDYDLEHWRVHSTRAEYAAWAKEHMPNGYCICYPERGIVCGQHDPRFHP